MNTEDSAREPAEHVRFAAYLVELDQVADADESALVGGVLADPDPVMAGAAVVRHLDRRAAELFPTPLWEEWAEAMARLMIGHPFPVRRLQEWSLFRAVALGLPWHRDDLLGASDWLQLKAADGTNPEALQVLAESGRTKRIRNAARTGLGRLGTGRTPRAELR
ncbi:hypothetical protein ABZ178_23405 [Streptomyces massasporeus]|uniref:hypothetical protein n=1 Tax=Streptomyces massasporeus TaxID=67324 RepID=UPI001673582F|nr:hypothetical protein [Streptomyces massasporeus]GGV76173.1 hypothetical protein GCM10010228_41090 [Streptomyces massasporeus]